MFTNIPSTILRKLVTLSERKEELMVQIQEIDREMTRLAHEADRAPGVLSHKGRVTFSAAPQKRPDGGRVKRGALKEKIVQALRAAGRKGITIRELSRKLGVRSANLYVWFNGTGKNVRGIQKIGVAKYRLR